MDERLYLDERVVNDGLTGGLIEANGLIMVMEVIRVTIKH